MKFDIELIKRKMLVKYPFFGSVVANVDYKANKNIPTAATDGSNIYYNPDFVETLKIDEQIFLFAHEICHIAFNHILRSEGKDQRIWNLATDAVINAYLKKDGLKMIEGGVNISDAINYDAEQLYEKLLKEEKERQQESQGNNLDKQNNQQGQSQENRSGKNGPEELSQDSETKNQTEKEQLESSDKENITSESTNSSNPNKEEKNQQDVGHDTYSMWEEAIKKHKEKKDKSNNESQKDNLVNKEKNSEIEIKQKKVENIGEKEAFRKNIEEKKKELEELKRALTKEVMGAGTTTNSELRNITDIGRAKPLIDWRYILKEAVKYDVDWSYKNASIEDGVISANLEQQPMPETEIVLDTSRSIDETLLKNFLRECKNILQQSKVKVGCFDTRFYGFNEIRNEEDIENMKFIGGGGTNFNVAVKAFTKRVENKIIFTDGDAGMPDEAVDAIWIVFGGKKINPKAGKVIQIDDEQLDRLYSFHNRRTR